MRYLDSDLEAIFQEMERLRVKDDALGLFVMGRSLLDRIEELRNWVREMKTGMPTPMGEETIP